MDAEERALLLGTYAGSSSDYPQTCVHQLFTEQAALRPDAEAVAFEGERLTYQQLDQRSNQVAHFLLAEGIRLQDRVGIFMSRSADMVVAMLGILKTGGTYVPIDIDYPAEQLKFIAEDTGLRWVLTQSYVNAVLPTDAPLIDVDLADSRLAHRTNQLNNLLSLNSS